MGGRVSTITHTNIDISTHILVVDTSILASSNMDWSSEGVQKRQSKKEQRWNFAIL
jgi:hypothetical protein